MKLMLGYWLKPRDRKRLRCSFCKKPAGEVRKLIAGPGKKLYICDECVRVCVDIVDGETDGSGAKGAQTKRDP